MDITKFVDSELKILWFITFSEIVLALLFLISFVTKNTMFAYGRYINEARFAKYYIPAKIAWCVQEIPCVLVPIYLFVFYKDFNVRNGANLIGPILLFVHYFQRCFIYPFLIQGGKPYPFHFLLGVFLFCLFNGYLQVVYHSSYAHYDDQHLTKPTTIIGFVLFLLGMSINIHSDHILRNLRKFGDTGYKIPHGGLFEYVSGANFFGEILEWFGYSMAVWSFPALSFAICTLTNTGIRAVMHHRWYLVKFDDYPKERKALIPYIF